MEFKHNHANVLETITLTIFLAPIFLKLGAKSLAYHVVKYKIPPALVGELLSYKLRFISQTFYALPSRYNMINSDPDANLVEVLTNTPLTESMGGRFVFAAIILTMMVAMLIGIAGRIKRGQHDWAVQNIILLTINSYLFVRSWRFGSLLISMNEHHGDSENNP